MRSVEAERKAAISSIVDRFLEREASQVDERDLLRESEERVLEEVPRVADPSVSSSTHRILDRGSYANMAELMGATSLRLSV